MNRLNIKIYNYFYNKAIEKYNQYHPDYKFTITDKEKSDAIDDIFSSLPFEEIEAIRVCIHHSYIENKNVWKDRDKRAMLKRFNIATRHMHYPANICKAVSEFYNTNPDGNSYIHLLYNEDFGFCRYIVNALNKSGIYSREQLMRHLSLGWEYLWSIPGCGDGARQEILRAIDRWNENR